MVKIRIGSIASISICLLLACQPQADQRTASEKQVLQKLLAQYTYRVSNLNHLRDRHIMYGGHIFQGDDIPELVSLGSRIEYLISNGCPLKLSPIIRQRIHDRLRNLETKVLTDTLPLGEFEHQVREVTKGKDYLSLILRYGALLEREQVEVSLQFFTALDENSTVFALEGTSPFADSAFFYVLASRTLEIPPSFITSEGRILPLQERCAEIRVPLSAVEGDSVQVVVKTPSWFGGMLETTLYLKQDFLPQVIELP